MKTKTYAPATGPGTTCTSAGSLGIKAVRTMRIPPQSATRRAGMPVRSAIEMLAE